MQPAKPCPVLVLRHLTHLIRGVPGHIKIKLALSKPDPFVKVTLIPGVFASRWCPEPILLDWDGFFALVSRPQMFCGSLKFNSCPLWTSWFMESLTRQRHCRGVELERFFSSRTPLIFPWLVPILYFASSVKFLTLKAAS